MTCDDVRRQLTPYLDGELDATRGSAVRGHLRGCEACRAIAGDEAALRDGLRSLPPVDPPASLWAGVQRKLAAAEIADADRPAWRRAFARWLRLLPSAPRAGLATVALAAAVTVLVWRAHSSHQPTVAQQQQPAPGVKAATPAQPVDAEHDVTADLAAEPARQTQVYADTARELLAAAGDARTRWTDDRKHAFDTRIVELQKKIDAAPGERPRQTAYRELIHYLRMAASLDEVAANDRMFAGGCP